MSKRSIFIEHDHVSAGGPIWAQFERRGYEITRFVIVDEENAKTPNVTPEWPDLLSFDVVVVMGAPFAAYDDERIGNWLLPQVKKMRAAVPSQPQSDRAEQHHAAVNQPGVHRGLHGRAQPRVCP